MPERAPNGYFVRDLIVFTDDFSSLQNLDDVDTSGIESYLHWDASDRIAVRLDYAHTHAQNTADGEELRRRPFNKVRLAFDFALNDRFSLATETTYIGHRYDTDAINFDRILRPGYALTNVTARYQFDPQWQYFIRVDNLFDRDYEEPDGFAQPGVGIFNGIRLSL